MSHQKVTCLTLLDISAAFDAIEYSVIRERHSVIHPGLALIILLSLSLSLSLSLYIYIYIYGI